MVCDGLVVLTCVQVGDAPVAVDRCVCRIESNGFSAIGDGSVKLALFQVDRGSPSKGTCLDGTVMRAQWKVVTGIVYPSWAGLLDNHITRLVVLNSLVTEQCISHISHITFYIFAQLRH